MRKQTSILLDLHPDSNYAPGSNPGTKCHRGTGESGILGTEKSSCDSPWSLINETFHWIDNNLKDVGQLSISTLILLL
jgi:endopolyphosphatase